jgi:tetratricopeptide (TPR) repeat protein
MSPRSNRHRLFCLAAALLIGGCAGPRTQGTGESVAGRAEALPGDYEQALELMRDGDYTAAAPALHAFSEAHPDLAGPLVNLGIAYRRTGDSAAALEALDRALELNPDNATAHLQRGILQREAGDFQAALAAYDSALTAQPDYALAHRNIGILYDLYLQQPARALTHYKRYLELLGEPDVTVSGWVIDLERRSVSAHASVEP